MTNLRVYVTSLERDFKLYKEELKTSAKKDSIIILKDSIISNKNDIILKHKEIIKVQEVDYNKIKKINEDLKDKYDAQRKAIPYFMGGSAVAGLLLCLILIK